MVKYLVVLGSKPAHIGMRKDLVCFLVRFIIITITIIDVIIIIIIKKLYQYAEIFLLNELEMETCILQHIYRYFRLFGLFCFPDPQISFPKK